MDRSYLALALATVLLLTSVLGASFTIRSLYLRRKHDFTGFRARTWHDITTPMPFFALATLTKREGSGLLHLARSVWVAMAKLFIVNK